MMTYAYEDIFTLSNGATIKVRADLTIHFTAHFELYPELTPASVNQKYDTEIFQFATPEIEKRFRKILRFQVNKWAAHQRSTQDALGGHEALEEQLKATDLSERDEKIVAANVIDISLRSERTLKDSVFDRIKRIVVRRV
jgi:hypothetical protein